MEKQDYKILEIEVGVDYPDVGLDDTFEIQLKLYENEIQSIIENGKKELWIDNDRETWEYLEDFAPTAFNRANILAEEYAGKRWGEQMLIKKSVPSLNGYDMYIEQAVVNGTTYHRLMLKPEADKLQKLCKDVIDAGFDCILK